MSDAAYSSAVIGLFILGFAVLLIWQRQQNRAANAFKSAANLLGIRPLVALPELTESGRSLSEGTFVSIARTSELFNGMKASLETIVASEEGKAALAEFVRSVGDRLVKADGTKAAEIAVAIFHISPASWNSHEYGLFLLRHMAGLPAQVSEWVYSTTLELLEHNRDAVACKRLALEAGRWHFGRIRDDRKVTIYDEQAIQNDILVRAQ